MIWSWTLWVPIRELPYNYTGIATGAPVYIADVNVSRVAVNKSTDFVDLNPDVFSAFVDFDLESVRNPHADGIPA